MHNFFLDIFSRRVGVKRDQRVSLAQRSQRGEIVGGATVNLAATDENLSLLSCHSI